MLSWRHTGFSVHNRVRVEPEDQQAVGRLARCIMRPPIGLDRMAWDGEGEVRSLTTPVEPLDLANSGNYTYATLGEEGMYVLDIRGCRHPCQNPNQPSSVIE